MTEAKVEVKEVAPDSEGDARTLLEGFRHREVEVHVSLEATSEVRRPGSFCYGKYAQDKAVKEPSKNTCTLPVFDPHFSSEIS